MHLEGALLPCKNILTPTQNRRFHENEHTQICAKTMSAVDIWSGMLWRVKTHWQTMPSSVYNNLLLKMKWPSVTQLSSSSNNWVFPGWVWMGASVHVGSLNPTGNNHKCVISISYMPLVINIYHHIYWKFLSNQLINYCKERGLAIWQPQSQCFRFFIYFLGFFQLTFSLNYKTSNLTLREAKYSYVLYSSHNNVLNLATVILNPVRR